MTVSINFNITFCRDAFCFSSLESVELIRRLRDFLELLELFVLLFVALTLCNFLGFRDFSVTIV